jgi:hypothetical protein
MPTNSSGTSSNRPAEDLNLPEQTSVVKEIKREDSDVQRITQNFSSETKSEVSGLDESVETNDRVSEVLSNKKDKASAGSGKKSGVYVSASKKEIETLKAQLLGHLPPEKVMKKQVEKEIRKEINYLRKRAMSLIGPSYSSSMSFFEASNLVRKIRELKGLLHSLVKVSLERLKTLWLRFVHGIM